MKAMNLVATSKLQRAKEHRKSVMPMFDNIRRILDGVKGSKEKIDNVFCNAREVKNIAYVVVTSDRGLCGPYNANICKVAYAAMGAEKGEKVIAVGNRGNDYFRRRGKDIIGKFASASDVSYYQDAQQIGNMLTSMYVNGEIDEVYVAYTQFESMMTHLPTIEKILPVTRDSTETAEKNFAMEYEPSIDSFLGYAVPMYLNVFLYGAMVESAVCEQAARMTSMDAANNNALELIDDLTLVLNRKRQDIITQELNEIIGGANALK